MLVRIAGVWHIPALISVRSVAAAEAAAEAAGAEAAEAAGAALEALEPPQATRERARAPAIAIVAIFFMIKISFSLFSQNTRISVFEKRPLAR